MTAVEGKVVDFGASDPPLKEAEETALSKVGEPVQIPMFLGAITVSYNLPGVKTGLKLDGKTIADIFLGKVKTWDDPEIKALNPGVTLPSTAITVIHRSDSSGTTRASPASSPRSTPNGRARSAPARTCRGRSAPARRATRASPARYSRRPARSATSSRPTPAAQLHLRQCQEQGWQLRGPDTGFDERGRGGLEVPANLGFAIKNPSAPGAYPITSQTFVVVYKDMCKAGIPGGKRRRRRREVPGLRPQPGPERSSRRPTTPRCRPRS